MIDDESIAFGPSLSGCPRASLNKKKAKFPGEEYLNTKFRASDGETSHIFSYVLPPSSLLMSYFVDTQDDTFFSFSLQS